MNNFLKEYLIQKIWIKSLPFNLKSMIGENITKDYISYFLENQIFNDSFSKS